MTWLEVRMTVSGELAEPVAEVLARYCTDGVVITATEDQMLTTSKEIRHTVAGYLPEDQGTARTKRQIEEALWHLSQIQPLPDPIYSTIEEQDWSESWRQHYKPIPIGERLLIQPSWIEPEVDDRIVININPGMAFGTGTHPTTILCLELLEQYLSPDHTVADLGCGTGILSIAAAKLGADRIFAFDQDREAVEATRSNAAINHVLEPIHIQQGSLKELRQRVEGGLQLDLILANILASVLTEFLNDGIAALLHPKGRLILSGILEEQSEELEALADHVGLRLVEKAQQGDWIALVLKMKPAPQMGAGSK